MALSPTSVRFLLSIDAKRSLANLAHDQRSHLEIATDLRRRFSAEEVHALLETTQLRQRALPKFRRAPEMLFTRDGLEQSSSETMGEFRALRFADAGFETAIDLGCGIGGDAIALSKRLQLIGVDRDETRMLMARHNVAVNGGGHFVPVVADLTRLRPAPLDGFFFDPARRDSRGRRFFRVADYQPPLKLIDSWLSVTAGGAVKISPGVDYGELPSGDVAEISFVSVDRDVKEAILWYGDLRRRKDTGSDIQRSATLLPSGHTLDSTINPARLPVTEPKRYLLEPDGAVIRAHLISELGALVDGCQIDATIAYLTSDNLSHTPFARYFEILDWFPFQLKRLRRYLRERNVGPLVVKKRGSPLDPDVLRKQLKLTGHEEATIILTRIKGQPVVLHVTPL